MKTAIAYARFTKATEASDGTLKLVGIATEEVPDSDGEILDYASSRDYFEQWSERTSEITGGKSLGAVRQQHSATLPVGKLTGLTLDDDAKQVRIVAKIIDKSCVALIKEGVLTGFSIGGRYLKKWADSGNSDLTRYTAEPVEISVCDTPSVRTAIFELVKSDGSIQLIGGSMKKTFDHSEAQEIYKALAELHDEPDAFDHDEACKLHKKMAALHSAAAESEGTVGTAIPRVTHGTREELSPKAGSAEFWKAIRENNRSDANNGLNGL